MVMTLAASTKAQWGQYAGWLPQVPTRFAATNSSAFGASGVAQQNLANSEAYGNQLREYREWSAKTQAEVTRDRQISQDRNNFDFRQNLGNVTRYDDPYTGRSVDLSSNNVVYWVNTTNGRILGDANSSFDPRTATDPNWQRMQTSGR